MPLQNRVTPLGELVANPARGLVFGNRGCLHDPTGRVRRSYSGTRWISCRLEFRGRRRPLLRPGHYTALFFLDEATAFAAGHRPCAECRHQDYVRFREAWLGLHPGNSRAEAIDARLQSERLGPGGAGQQHHRAEISSLPDGAFVLHDDVPCLVLGDRLRRWTPGGYADAPARPPRGTITVITPPSLVEVLRGGWESCLPLTHPSAAC